MSMITVGNSSVYDSGTVISLPGESVVFNFGSLQFHFLFKDTEDNKQRTEIEQDGDTTLKLLFYNFNNPLGTGIKEPLCLGTLQGKQLLLQYRIHALGDGTQNNVGKTIHYTWYLKEEK